MFLGGIYALVNVKVGFVGLGFFERFDALSSFVAFRTFNDILFTLHEFQLFFVEHFDFYVTFFHLLFFSVREFFKRLLLRFDFSNASTEICIVLVELG